MNRQTSTSHLPLCWLNPGEIVVKGPLNAGHQYKFHSITWLENGNIFHGRWPAGFPNVFLPPQRPYDVAATTRAIENWWNDARFQVWRDEVARHDTQIRALREAAENLRGFQELPNL
jgi:hypothetical protein